MVWNSGIFVKYIEPMKYIEPKRIPQKQIPINLPQEPLLGKTIAYRLKSMCTINVSPDSTSARLLLNDEAMTFAWAST